MTSCAAPAISSATAISVAWSSYPAESSAPSRSWSAVIPATPRATSVVPRRHARPKESETTIADLDSRRARGSDRGGQRPMHPGRAAAARACRAPSHSKRRPRQRRRRSRAWSRRSRGAVGRERPRWTPAGSPRAVAGRGPPASSRARVEGSTSARSTTRPSTFETAFCATTTTSWSTRPPTALAARTTWPPRSSPSSSSGIPRSGRTRTSSLNRRP